MIISILQIIVSVIVVALILLQERSSGLSAIFGGDSSGLYQTRRGLEKTIFILTIVFGVIFLTLATLNLLF